MVQDNLPILTRRSFLRAVALGACSISFLGSVIAEDKTPTRLVARSDATNMEVEVYRWVPVDITDRIRVATGQELDFRENQSNLYDNANLRRPINITDQVPVERFFRGALPEVIGEEMGRYVLINADSRRAYALTAGDEEILGAGSKGFTLDQGFGIRFADAENGMVNYDIYLPTRVKEDYRSPNHGYPDVSIVADFRNSRKFVFRLKNNGEQRSHFSALAHSGNRAVISSFWKPFAISVFDFDKQGIIYESTGGVFRGINAEGSVLAIQDGTEGDYANGSYYREEIPNGKRDFMFPNDFSKRCFIFSPDGNFCACVEEVFGPCTIQVYEHSTRKRFSIDHPWERDEPRRVENDGTVHAASGTYKYQDGKYVWATEGKEQPEGLRIY